MTTVERLEELKTVDIKEIERDSLPKYKDLISELDSRKSNKMEVLLNHSDNPYVYEDPQPPTRLETGSAQNTPSVPRPFT